MDRGLISWKNNNNIFFKIENSFSPSLFDLRILGIFEHFSTTAMLDFSLKTRFLEIRVQKNHGQP